MNRIIRYVYGLVMMSFMMCVQPVYAEWLFSTSIQKLSSTSRNYDSFAHSSTDTERHKYYYYNMNVALLGFGYGVFLDESQSWHFVPEIAFGKALEPFELSEVNHMSVLKSVLREYTYTNKVTSLATGTFRFTPKQTQWKVSVGLQFLYQNNEVIETFKSGNQTESVVSVYSAGWQAGLGYRFYELFEVTGLMGVAYHQAGEVSTSQLRFSFHF
jgi:hypothetical protein